MRIAVVSPGAMRLPPARCTSVEIYAMELARRLSRHEQVILYGKGDKNERMRRQQLLVRTWVTRGGLSYARQVASEVKQRGCDVVQIENRIPFVPLFKKSSPSTHVVLNLHSNVLIGSLPLVKVEAAVRRMDALVVNSQFLKDDLLTRYPVLQGKQVQVIHPGIDVRRFPSRFSEKGARLREKVRRRYRIRPEQRVLLSVGRFIPRKGIDVLLDSFREVVREHPESELWIIGGRPVKRDDPFHRLILEKARGLPVRFLGFVGQQELPAYYAAADLFVCPSQRAEAFGLVNLEAAAAGVPVVASDAWGIREAVQDGDAGMLVEAYKQPDAWAETIKQLLSDTQRLQTMGRAARAFAKGFAWERTAEQFLALYQRLRS